MTYDNMTKDELRTACKNVGIPYSKLNNEGMRAALQALHPAPAPTEQGEINPPGSYPDIAGFGGTEVEPGRPGHNGITRPRAGGKCAAIWDGLDAIMAGGTKPTAAQVRELAAAQGWDKTTAQVQFYQWRKFNGISGR